MAGFTWMLATSVALMASASALPQGESQLRGYDSHAEACTACLLSSGLAQHACNCCDSWSRTYCGKKGSGGTGD
ncbi:hypothetical protein HBI24_049570 [Parastagonospora nodorum]|uniref:Uncharacterized protein n=1 Tax=Phaeosphaeria nodorum (strain SN15 / ATCC MYA-4574 / FGSC 10173) TaxID=321614 RepID=A0A7U2I5G6_PHANO|nr:hypothetical protein HBH95_117580 [Parastagonospora nodorum]QRD02540.1 hypothetical protein JI435_441040 [Parastagonospora nodorum SN15]KAH5155348.1 hypothetical protein HBH69_111160 [Parastagonospora nodorum]KAH5212984.1 hypothetical protein HBH77_070580 [Parastagonospora nodorum]KAH5269058.1 hypothetical protein HBI72_076350 [Parastagonospora nodorum]